MVNDSKLGWPYKRTFTVYTSNNVLLRAGIDKFHFSELPDDQSNLIKSGFFRASSYI